MMDSKSITLTFEDFIIRIYQNGPIYWIPQITIN